MRSGHGRFKSAAISNAERTSKRRDQTGVDRDHLVHRRVRRHCARRRSNSGCSSMNSSTAARNGEEEEAPRRLRNSINRLTDSCSSGVSERIVSTRFSVAMIAFAFSCSISGAAPRALSEGSGQLKNRYLGTYFGQRLPKPHPNPLVCLVCMRALVRCLNRSFRSTQIQRPT